MADAHVKRGISRWAVVGGALLVLIVGFLSYRVQSLTGEVARLEGENAVLSEAVDSYQKAGQAAGIDGPTADEVTDPDVVEPPVVVQRGADGTDGATGPRGPRGYPGEDGSDGAAGPAGPQGEPGEEGPPGKNGPALIGPQGEQGPAGPIGATGPAGPQGEQGPVGPIGATGPGPAGIVIPDGQGGYCTAVDRGDGVYACSSA